MVIQVIGSTLEFRSQCKLSGVISRHYMEKNVSNSDIQTLMNDTEWSELNRMEKGYTRASFLK
jgi:hypothetical protein